MKNLGEKPKKMDVAVSPNSVEYFPSLDLTSKKVPEVADFKIGDVIEIKAKCKVKGIRESYDEKDVVRAEISITAIEISDGPDDFKEAKERRLSRKDWDDIKNKGKK